MLMWHCYLSHFEYAKFLPFCVRIYGHIGLIAKFIQCVRKAGRIDNGNRPAKEQRNVWVWKRKKILTEAGLEPAASWFVVKHSAIEPHGRRIETMVKYLYKSYIQHNLNRPLTLYSASWSRPPKIRIALSRLISYHYSIKDISFYSSFDENVPKIQMDDFAM